MMLAEVDELKKIYAAAKVVAQARAEATATNPMAMGAAMHRAKMAGADFCRRSAYWWGDRP